jgi:hypothetical protein
MIGDDSPISSVALTCTDRRHPRRSGRMWRVARRACIRICAVLAARQDEMRCMWLADSFALPRQEAANCRADGWIRMELVAAVLAVAEALHSASHTAFLAHHGYPIGNHNPHAMLTYCWRCPCCNVSGSPFAVRGRSGYQAAHQPCRDRHHQQDALPGVFAQRSTARGVPG